MSLKPPDLGTDWIWHRLDPARRAASCLKVEDADWGEHDRRALWWLLARGGDWRLVHGKFPANVLELDNAQADGAASGWIAVVRDPLVWVGEVWAKLDAAQRVLWEDWLKRGELEPLQRWRDPLCRYLGGKEASLERAWERWQRDGLWLGTVAAAEGGVSARWLKQALGDLLAEATEGAGGEWGSRSDEGVALPLVDPRLGELVAQDVALLERVASSWGSS